MSHNLQALLSQVVALLEQSGAEFAVTGAAALELRGAPRPAEELEVLFHLERIRMPAFLERLGETGFQFDPSPALRALSERRVLRLAHPQGTLELIPAVIPYFHQVIRNASAVTLLDGTAKSASQEDAVLMTLLGADPVQEADFRLLLQEQAPSLDAARLLDQAQDLLAADDPRLNWLS